MWDKGKGEQIVEHFLCIFSHSSSRLRATSHKPRSMDVKLRSTILLRSLAHSIPITLCPSRDAFLRRVGPGCKEMDFLGLHLMLLLLPGRTWPPQTDCNHPSSSNQLYLVFLCACKRHFSDSEKVFPRSCILSGGGLAPSSRLQSPLLIQSIVGSLSCRSLIAALNSYDSKWRHVDTNYEQKLHLYSPLIVFTFRYVGKPIRECRSAFCNVVSERKLFPSWLWRLPKPQSSVQHRKLGTLHSHTLLLHQNHSCQS